MKKRMISVLLMLGISVSALAGCGSGNTEKTAETKAAADTKAEADESVSEEGAINMEEEPYTVAIQVVTLPGTQFEGEEAREEAINAITVPAINCKVDIQEVWISEVANTTSMAVAGDEKVDLVHVATVNPLSSLVGSDILLDMNEDDLLAAHGQDLVELFGDLLDVGEINGQQLAIPAKTFNASAKGFFYNKTLADEYGVTIPEKGTLDDIEKALYAVKEANPDIMPFVAGEGQMNFLYWIQGYEGFGNEASYGAILDPNSELKVENVYASDAFKDYCVRMYKWRVDGLQPGDPTDTNSAQDYMNAQQQFANTGDITEKLKAEYEAQADFEYGWCELVEPKITNSTMTEYMWGIASNSERPDKAMDFLNFLYTNADVANILKFGLEGDNYDFQEGSEDIIVSNNTYIPLFYIAGDEKSMFIQAPAGEDFLEKTMAMEEAANVSPVCNYMFDDTEFQTESAVIYATILEYLPRLQNGTCESEEATLALLDEFNQKLSASGIDDVIAANQTQLDTWLAAQ